MKSALCLLSGKSCARLIEMFIRQIYRDETEEGRAGSTMGSEEAGGSSGRPRSSPEGKGMGAGTGGWCGTCEEKGTALTHGKENRRRELGQLALLSPWGSGWRGLGPRGLRRFGPFLEMSTSLHQTLLSLSRHITSEKL